MTTTVPLLHSDHLSNGAGQDTDPITQLVETAERYKVTSKAMVMATNTATEAERALREADCLAQDVHNKAWEVHLTASENGPETEMGFTAPSREQSGTDLNGVAQEAEWAKLRVGVAEVANKRAILFAEQVQAQLDLLKAELLSLACSLPTVGDEPADSHFQLVGTSES
jgi:hypothetical protein